MKKDDLKVIPGVGKNMEKHLNDLGYYSLDSLKGANPMNMYKADCELHGGSLDRCVLYVYRLAVYYAENDNYDKEKLDWWYWKSETYNE